MCRCRDHIVAKCHEGVEYVRSTICRFSIFSCTVSAGASYTSSLQPCISFFLAGLTLLATLEVLDCK